MISRDLFSLSPRSFIHSVVEDLSPAVITDNIVHHDESHLCLCYSAFPSFFPTQEITTIEGFIFSTVRLQNTMYKQVSRANTCVSLASGHAQTHTISGKCLGYKDFRFIHEYLIYIWMACLRLFKYS